MIRTGLVRSSSTVGNRVDESMKAPDMTVKAEYKLSIEEERGALESRTTQIQEGEDDEDINDIRIMTTEDGAPNQAITPPPLVVAPP